MISPFKDDRI